ncbi:hypothetical protein A5886_000417 [Enterococcus sp. 8G7_MSG3316]|uniref:DUF871 domain-containing protein n=1 Tax=Candidatus Enterococcus testudinis TaxID=1834191 RepID=A0A242A2S8_9ENTE|nr:MupG family TIM beta-alpha barrel fold protein [Enterococcus sp. 8G7_MSG3316]OTN75347.1 hypothetical protein A5886_000417 [Enterococcus sp. 8G7_MSG3316]
MFGFSVFMNQDVTPSDLAQMEELAVSFDGMFTSMHIPEDDSTRYRERLGVIGAFAKRHQLSLMVDISGNALTEAGFSIDRLEELIDLGVTGLRMDYAIDNQQIAQFSKQMRIALNASTLTEKDVQELQTYGADFTQLEAWHNYYPRPETGLAEEWLQAKNRWLKEQGFYVQAFVPGDDRLRGPMYAGLPTLEDHRGMTPFAAALALQETGTVDAIYIGDGGLTRQSIQQFNDYMQQNLITLRVKAVGSAYLDTVIGLHQNRQDEARDVLRSADARFGDVSFVKPEARMPRPIGAVTIDNQAYERYMGEIQVCKNALPADPRVNVAAQVIAADLPLIQHIHAGMRFKIERDDSNE